MTDRAGSMPQLLHLVARALPGMVPFNNVELAWWFWLRLRRRWPLALAACLMPDHLHLLIAGIAKSEHIALGALISGLTRHCKARRIWLEVPPARVIPDRKHLMRHVRYIHLNPCRSKLVKDPLAWPFSTHRGVVGAEVDPWTPAPRLAEALDWSKRSFVERFHDYVSGDPDVKVDGTPLPRPASPKAWPSVPLETIITAAISATPWSSRSERRHLAALLAQDQGWDDARVVGRAMNVDANTVRRFAAQPDTIALNAGRLCLNDPRLRISAQHAAPLRESVLGPAGVARRS